MCGGTLRIKFPVIVCSELVLWLVLTYCIEHIKIKLNFLLVHVHNIKFDFNMCNTIPTIPPQH